MRKIMTMGLILVMVLMGFVALASPIASEEECEPITIFKCALPWGGQPWPWDNENVPVGQNVEWEFSITVTNNMQDPITNVRVKDRFGGELESDSGLVLSPSHGTATITLKGMTEKMFLDWYIGTLGPGESARLTFYISTDINPGGHQSYTSTGTYLWNSGSVVKYEYPVGEQHSVHSNLIWVNVVDINGGFEAEDTGFGLPAE
jgi:uncharacterized repeat protein (TIGR01451 family)